jgi:hypothetical protein
VEPKRGTAASSCSVIGGEKIPQAAGGSEALCREIERLLADDQNIGSATIVVDVRRSHMRANVALEDGRRLPEIGLAVSDAALSSNAIKKFAARIAAAVRRARS